MAKRDRLLYVEWDDASSHDNTWAQRGMYESHNEPDGCQSVGWLIAENDKAITLCASRSTQNNQLCGDMIIPKSAIRKRRILRYKQ